MDILEIKKRIKEIIIDVMELEDTTPDDINDEDSFYGDEEKQEHGLIDDSLMILELISAVSEEYDLEPSVFQDEDFKNINTLADAVVSALAQK